MPAANASSSASSYSSRASVAAHQTRSSPGLRRKCSHRPGCRGLPVAGHGLHDRGDAPGHGARRAADVEDGLRRQPERVDSPAGGPSTSVARRRGSRSGTRSSHLPTIARSSGADGAAPRLLDDEHAGRRQSDGLAPDGGAVGDEADVAQQVGGGGEAGMVGGALVGKRDRTARRALEGASPGVSAYRLTIMPNEPKPRRPHAREQRERCERPLHGRATRSRSILARPDRRRGDRPHRRPGRRRVAVRRRAPSPAGVAAAATSSVARRPARPRRRWKRLAPTAPASPPRPSRPRTRRRPPPTRREAGQDPQAQADPHARPDPAARQPHRSRRFRGDDPRRARSSGGSTSGASSTLSPACRSRSSPTTAARGSAHRASPTWAAASPSRPRPGSRSPRSRRRSPPPLSCSS